MMTGAELIAQERERQQMEEGYPPEWDLAHNESELAQFAACYCLVYHDPKNVAEHMPSDFTLKREAYPYPSVKDLVRAGALIAAEIDRLNTVATNAEPTK